jgi:hypothetical protein
LLLGLSQAYKSPLPADIYAHALSGLCCGHGYVSL